MKRITGIIFLIFLLAACKNNSAEKKSDQASLNERLTNMNRKMVENESKRIDEFITSHSYKTTRTGTGLRYEIYKHGSGESPGLRSIVDINYKVYLLDGTFCYSNDSAGPQRINLGIGEQVSGLEEGLMLMVPGDRARLILPAHLGYGMSGDQSKIPPASAIYYDVELLNISK